VPQYEEPRNRDARNEVPQSEGAQNEVPQKKESQKEGATAGYFIMAHAVFHDPTVRTLSGDGFRVFLWMSCQAWRFRNSIGQVQAAVSWIARETGVSEAAVSRILRLLTDRGLIKRVRVDYQIGNLWEVIDLAKWRAGDGEEPKQRPQNEVPRIEVPQNQGPAPSKRSSRTIKMREQHPQNEGDIINITYPAFGLPEVTCE
jgi:DNA-binding transcriptional ArsR family regulator